MSRRSGSLVSTPTCMWFESLRLVPIPTDILAVEEETWRISNLTRQVPRSLGWRLRRHILDLF